MWLRPLAPRPSPKIFVSSPQLLIPLHSRIDGSAGRIHNNPISRYYESRALANITDEALGSESAIRPHVVLLFKDAAGEVIDRAFRLLPYEVLGTENGGTYYGSGKTFVLHSESTYGSQFWRFSRKVYKGSGDSSPMVIKQKMDLKVLKNVASVEVMLADYPLPGENGTPDFKPGSSTNAVMTALAQIAATNTLASMWKPTLESARVISDPSRGQVVLVTISMVPNKARLKAYYSQVMSVLDQRYYRIPFRPQAVRALRYDEYIPCLHPAATGFFDGIQDYRESNLVLAFNNPVYFFERTSSRYNPDRNKTSNIYPLKNFWDGFDTDAWIVKDINPSAHYYNDPLISNLISFSSEIGYFCNDTDLPAVVVEFRDGNNQIVRSNTRILSLDALGQTRFSLGTGATQGSRLGRLFHFEEQAGTQYYFPEHSSLREEYFDFLGLGDAVGSPHARFWQFYIGTSLSADEINRVVNITFGGNASPPPTITTTLLPVASALQSYSSQLGAVGGDMPYQWQVVAGTLPDGLVLSADGLISGIPSTSSTNSFVAQVVGANGATYTTNLQLTVVPEKPKLSVRILGKGTVSPNYDGQALEVGPSYSMTAAPVGGFSFGNWTVSTNWIGGTTSAVTTLQFVMEPGLTIQALFRDTAVPTVSITSPTPNQVCISPVFIARGLASDNDLVTAVTFRVNGGTWRPATTDNNWASWSVETPVREGTNTVQAYATDAAGNQSDLASVDVVYAIPPQIVVSPQNATVPVESNTTFSAVASGTAPLSYSWQQNGVNVPGVEGPQLTIVATSTNHAGLYTVTVTNIAGRVTSAAARLTVVPSGDASERVLGIVRMNNAVSLRIPPGNSSLVVEKGTKFGEWSPFLNMPSRAVEQLVGLDLEMRNTASGAPVFYRLAFGSPNLAGEPPTIVTQPSPVTATQGESVSLSVGVTGTGILLYQWFKDGAAIPNAVSSSFAIVSVSQTNAGTYYAIVSSSYGSAKSQDVIVSVTAGLAPFVKQILSFTSYYYNAGSDVRLEIARYLVGGGRKEFEEFVGGTSPFGFVWFRDGTKVGESSVPSFLTPAIPGRYTVTVSNNYGGITIALGQLYN